MQARKGHFLFLFLFSMSRQRQEHVADVHDLIPRWEAHPDLVPVSIEPHHLASGWRAVAL